MLFVSCKECRESSFPMAALRKSSAIEFKEVNSKIEELSKKLESFSTVEGKVNESIQMIKEQTAANKLNYADMVKKSTESREDILRVKEAVQESAKDHSEHEERDRSIMIFNCNESSSDNKASRSEDDLAYVENFIDKGLSISPQEVQSHIRLGFYKDDGTKRPMKITFDSKSSQVKVMDHLYRLRDADQVYKSVSVSIDRSNAERESYKQLVIQANERSQADNRTFVVRGTYRPYIVEKRQ